MPIIQNNRAGILVLPKSKLTLRRGAQVEVPALGEELQNAVNKGWVKVITPEESKPNEKTGAQDDAGKTPLREWEIDYSQAKNGAITITDRTTGKSIQAEVSERKGEQYFTLKNFGTVKGQTFWPTTQALERLDAAE